MTPSPSEMALAIYKKYSMVSFQTKFNKGHCLPKEIAKKCALIDVEGKIELFREYCEKDLYDLHSVVKLDHWQQVKEEIPGI